MENKPERNLNSAAIVETAEAPELAKSRLVYSAELSREDGLLCDACRRKGRIVVVQWPRWSAVSAERVSVGTNRVWLCPRCFEYVRTVMGSIKLPEGCE